MNRLYLLFVQVSKCCFRKTCLWFRLNSGSFSAEMNQENESNKSWLFQRKQTGVKCCCPELCIGDNWSCFTEFIGCNSDQICFCGIHIPSHFSITHPPFQPSISMGVISFIPTITTQEHHGLSSGTSQQSKESFWKQGLLSFCFTN